MTPYAPAPSKDGKRMFFIGVLPRGEMLQRDAKSRHFVPFLPGLSAENISFSRDGQSMAYVAYPEGTLWRAESEGWRSGKTGRDWSPKPAAATAPTPDSPYR